MNGSSDLRNQATAPGRFAAPALTLLPPPELCSSRLRSVVECWRPPVVGFPPMAPVPRDGIGRHAATRRGFLLLAAGTALAPLGARAASGPLRFAAPQPEGANPGLRASPRAQTEADEGAPGPGDGRGAAAAAQPLRLGEIPADFWERPRELILQRQGTKDRIQVVYWRDGQLVADGYWQVCALLRDVRANRMTAIDPLLMDILRGITGYYQAWRWPGLMTVTSGFRTEETNRALSREGAAKNSMHLYGKAVDVHMPGIPAKDIAALGRHFQQGGVGFYPSRAFTHLDTGRQRFWQG